MSQNNLVKSEFVNRQCLTVKHEDNYLLLGMLLPVGPKANEEFISTVSSKPRLVLKILNRYKYTTELVMNYQFEFGNSEDINIKLYHDARLAEIVYCTDVQRFIRLMGPKVCHKIHKQTRVSLNMFLNKWLKYLLVNGYGRNSWNKLS